MQAEAKDIITFLLQQSALDRLGTGSALEVKKHHYFAGIDWGNLLRMKADFKSRELFRNSISQCESSDTSDQTFSLVRACFGIWG